MKRGQTAVTTRRAHGDRGAVMIEAAIAMPVFVSLLLGMFTGGFALNHKLDMTLAARESARYGSTVSADQCSSKCNGMNWAQLVGSIAVQRSEGDLRTADVCVALVQGPGSNPTAV